MGRTRNPYSRLLMMRKKNIYGSYFQRISGSVMAKSVGSFIDRSDNVVLGNMVAWYKQGVGITVEGQGVSVWADASGNGNKLVQAVDSNRPIPQLDAGGNIELISSSNKGTTIELRLPIIIK